MVGPRKRFPAANTDTDRREGDTTHRWLAAERLIFVLTPNVSQSSSTDTSCALCLFFPAVRVGVLCWKPFHAMCPSNELRHTLFSRILKGPKKGLNGARKNKQENTILLWCLSSHVLYLSRRLKPFYPMLVPQKVKFAV